MIRLVHTRSPSCDREVRGGGNNVTFILIGFDGGATQVLHPGRIRPPTSLQVRPRRFAYAVSSTNAMQARGPQSEIIIPRRAH